MNLNIYLEEQLAMQLNSQAVKLHRKKNSIIREAIAEWLNKHSDKCWPKSVIEFEGIEGWNEIDELRINLSNNEKELF
jgi:predicted transcriptional regulator